MRIPNRGMRMPNRRAFVAAVLFAAVGVGAGSQDAAVSMPLSIESAVEAAVASSTSVRSLEIRLADQLEDLGIMGYLDGIRLSLSGSLGGSPDSDLSYSSRGQLSANVEIIPQLSLNGSVTANLLDDGVGPAPEPLTASLGLTLSPLADPTGRGRDLITVDQSTIDLAVAVDAASYTAVIRLLDAVAAADAIVIDQERVAIAEENLANSQALFERERISDDQLEASKKSLRSAVQNLLRGELSAERATANLAQTVGISANTVTLPDPSALMLDSIVSKARDFIEAADVALLAENDPGPRSALLDVQSAELDVRSALVFGPQFSVSASAGLPDLNYSVSAEISISPSDIDLDARNTAIADLADAERAYEYALRVAEFDVRSAIMDLEFALDDLSDAVYDLEQAQKDLEEANFFLERGEITALDFKQAKLDLAVAQNNVTAAKISVAKRWYAIEFRQ